MTHWSVIDLKVTSCQAHGQLSITKQIMGNDGLMAQKNLSRAQQRRRDDIVKAALEVFERDGYEAAKMADIAQLADVAKGTLYLYFDTKAALLEGALQTAILPALNQIGNDAKDHSGSAQALLEHQVRVMAARQASPEMKLLLRIMMSEPDQHQVLIKFFKTHVVQEGLTLIQNTLRMGVETGEFRADAAHLDPLVIVGSHVYAAVWNNLFGSEASLDIDGLVESNLNLLLNGLRAVPQS